MTGNAQYPVKINNNNTILYFIVFFTFGKKNVFVYINIMSDSPKLELT